MPYGRTHSLTPETVLLTSLQCVTSWVLQSIHPLRSFNTIGIGRVFLNPPKSPWWVILPVSHGCRVVSILVFVPSDPGLNPSGDGIFFQSLLGCPGFSHTSWVMMEYSLTSWGMSSSEEVMIIIFRLEFIEQSFSINDNSH